MTEPRLKYRWARTWPDKSQDFTAWDGEKCIGRVYRHTSGPSPFWAWHMNADDRFDIRPVNGSAGDKTEACRMLEEAYEKVTQPPSPEQQ